MLVNTLSFASGINMNLSNSSGNAGNTANNTNVADNTANPDDTVLGSQTSNVASTPEATNPSTGTRKLYNSTNSDLTVSYA